ncbi:MAG: alpha/beta hydrolase [Betaproteobacteria bacterium]|nr:alpha/beta hydrolase [Betaproteobacteria bacterium]MDH5220322.1 alpha/beta hydrolase [Betaproteobacteria bacterium]MDH5349765.1 alpha/beta hydrolase [Betaproteobacteria bacterium]
MSLHPKIVQLLERAAQSPLPQLYEVPAHVARRIYRDTRAALAPQAPEVAESRLTLAPGPVALRAYRPLGAKPDDALPALVYFHGGGWVIGDLDTHDVLCRQLANGARCAVYSVDYRMGPEHPFPAAVEDCIAATRFVASRHAQVAVGGDSAGGNLATVVALHARDAGGPAIAYQLLIYPATDQRLAHPSIRRNGEGYLLTKKSMDYFQAQYLPNKSDLLDWRASPLLARSLAGLPPAYVITAGYDPLLDEGREYAERMAKEGVDVSYREYADMIHGFILFGGVLDTANAAVQECCEKLRNAFAGVTA